MVEYFFGVVKESVNETVMNRGDYWN